MGGYWSEGIDRQKARCCTSNVLPSDIDALVTQMEKMISDEDLRQAIAAESSLLAHTTFNVKTINQQLGEMYEEVMEVMTNEERWDAFIVELRAYIEEHHHLDNTKGILPAPLGIPFFQSA